MGYIFFVSFVFGNKLIFYKKKFVPKKISTNNFLPKSFVCLIFKVMVKNKFCPIFLFGQICLRLFLVIDYLMQGKTKVKWRDIIDLEIFWASLRCFCCFAAYFLILKKIVQGFSNMSVKLWLVRWFWIFKIYKYFFLFLLEKFIRDDRVL